MIFLIEKLKFRQFMVIASQHVASSECYFSVVIVESVKSLATENNSKVTGLFDFDTQGEEV